MEIKLLSCPLCMESHFQNITLLRNALINVTKKPLSCPICDDVLLGLDKFTIHLFTHCALTNESDKNKNLDKNVNSTNDNNNNNSDQETNSTCIILNNNNNNSLTSTNNNNVVEANNFTWSLDNRVDDNVQETQEIPSKNAHCEICNFDFTDTNMLEMHRTLLHSNGFSCHLCHKKFKMHGSLMVHMRVAHYGFKSKLIITDNVNIKGNILSNNLVVNENGPLGLPKIDNKQWECDVCLKKFTTKYFLKKHKRLHTGEMPYECTLCNKSFTFQQSYHKHMLYHSADKPHSCNECGRAFKELSTLHNHQRIHSGERPFGCETCGKRFRQRVSYLVHKRIHTGAMPYKCTSCDKSFRYKVSQRTHKCKAQPPGSVVRQFGDLVQKLLQNRPLEEVANINTSPKIENTTNSSISISNRNDLLTNSNSPIASTSSDVSNEKPTIEQCPEINTDFFGLVMSPTFQITSDQFESLCLTNKEIENNNTEDIFSHLRRNLDTDESNNVPRQECSTINEECFKQLLYNTSNQ